MVEESLPEPAYESLQDGTPSSQELKCNAVADVARYECETKLAHFRQTCRPCPRSQ